MRNKKDNQKNIRLRNNIFEERRIFIKPWSKIE